RSAPPRVPEFPTLDALSGRYNPMCHRVGTTRAAMRLPATLLIAICALAAGCTSLTSRTRDRNRNNDPPPLDRGGNSREWWLDGAERAKGKTRQVPADVARTDRDGIIAGVLVDAREGRPMKGVTYVQV